MFDIAETLRELAQRGEDHAVATVVAARGGAAKVGSKAIYLAGGKRHAGDAIFAAEAESVIARHVRTILEAGEPELIDLDEEACGACLKVFIEPVVRKSEILVLGAGPVAQALAKGATAFGFKVRLRAPSVAPIAGVRVEEGSYEKARGDGAHVVVATGHEADDEALLAVLGGKPASVQLVASRKRWPTLRDQLARKVPADALSKVRSPAGLDIGSEGPEEIALSILSEIVLLRRGGTGQPLSATSSGAAVTPAPKPSGEERPTVLLTKARMAEPSLTADMSHMTNVAIPDEEDFRDPTPSKTLPTPPFDDVGDLRSPLVLGPNGTERYGTSLQSDLEAARKRRPIQTDDAPEEEEEFRPSDTKVVKPWSSSEKPESSEKPGKPEPKPEEPSEATKDESSEAPARQWDEDYR